MNQAEMLKKLRTLVKEVEADVDSPVTEDAYLRVCRTLNWRNAQLRANGIEPLQLEDHHDHYPPEGYEFGVNQNGYVTAFYKIAEMLGIGARADTPKWVFENEMLPKLKLLIDDGEIKEQEMAFRAGFGAAYTDLDKEKNYAQNLDAAWKAYNDGYVEPKKGKIEIANNNIVVQTQVKNRFKVGQRVQIHGGPYIGENGIVRELLSDLCYSVKVVTGPDRNMRGTTVLHENILRAEQ